MWSPAQTSDEVALEALALESRAVGDVSELWDELGDVVRYLEYVRRKLEQLKDEHDVRARRRIQAAYHAHGVSLEELFDLTAWDPVDLEAAIGAPVDQGRLDQRIPDGS